MGIVEEVNGATASINAFDAFMKQRRLPTVLSMVLTSFLFFMAVSMAMVANTTNHRLQQKPRA
jgi:hypothetical protein